MTTAAPRASRLSAALDVCRVAPAYAGFGVLKRLVPLPTLVRWAWSDTVPGGRADVDRAVRAVGWLSRRLAPAWGAADCLQRSLVLYRALSRAGARPTLVMGFDRRASGLAGHVWVSVSGPRTSVLAEEVSGFAVTARFGDRGERIEDAGAPQECRSMMPRTADSPSGGSSSRNSTPAR